MLPRATKRGLMHGIQPQAMLLREFGKVAAGRSQGAECDQCGTVGPEEIPFMVPGGRSSMAPYPTGWIYAKHDVQRHVGADALTFCSWRCVAEYANKQPAAA